MVLFFKSIAIGVMAGLAGALFLYTFSDFISEKNEALALGVFIGVAFLSIDLIIKKLKTNNREGS